VLSSVSGRAFAGVFVEYGTRLRGDRRPILIPEIRARTGPPVFREAELEKLGVETIAKIRRAYFAQKVTIKAIWCALHLARKLGLQ
jgi:hypothetical protein